MSAAVTSGGQAAAGSASQATPELTHVVVELNHESPLICCRFDPTGRFVFATGQDRTIQRFDLASSHRVALLGHESWVRDLTFAPDGRTMVSGGYDGRIIWWPADAEQPEPIRTVQAHQGWIRSVAISPDGRWLATGGNDNMVRLWDPIEGAPIAELAGHQSHVYCVRFHPQSTCLLSGDLSGSVRQWDLAAGSTARTFDASALHTYTNNFHAHYGGVRSMEVSTQLNMLACGGMHKGTNPFAGSRKPLVMLFDWQTQKLLRSLVLSVPVDGEVCRFKFHPNGFLVGGAGPFLVFWKPDQDQEFAKLKLTPSAQVREMDMHSDGLRLASVHHDGKLFISRMAAKNG